MNRGSLPSHQRLSVIGATSRAELVTSVRSRRAPLSSERDRVNLPRKRRGTRVRSSPSEKGENSHGLKNKLAIGGLGELTGFMACSIESNSCDWRSRLFRIFLYTHIHRVRRSTEGTHFSHTNVPFVCSIQMERPHRAGPRAPTVRGMPRKMPDAHVLRGAPHRATHRVPYRVPTSGYDPTETPGATIA